MAAPATTMHTKSQGIKGKVVQIIGSVVDAEFPEDQLPEIYDAIEILSDDGRSVTCEVQTHLGNNAVRAVSMTTTDGLRRGMDVVATGGPISVPVGPNTLGRVFDVMGKPIDEKGPVESDTYYPIHRPSPPLVDQITKTEVFETGLKVVDLIAPFTKGGKTGVFGGAGVGKTVTIA